MTPLPWFRRTGNATCGPLPSYCKSFQKKWAEFCPARRHFFWMLSQTYMNVWRHSKSFPAAINGHGNGHGLGGRGEAPGRVAGPFTGVNPVLRCLRAKKKGPGQNDKKRRKPASQPGHHSTPERKNAFRIQGFPEVVGDVCLSSWGVGSVCLSVCLSLPACMPACLPVCLSGQPCHGTSYMYGQRTCLEVYNHMAGVRVPPVKGEPSLGR